MGQQGMAFLSMAVLRMVRETTTGLRFQASPQALERSGKYLPVLPRCAVPVLEEDTIWAHHLQRLSRFRHQGARGARSVALRKRRRQLWFGNGIWGLTTTHQTFQPRRRGD